VDLSSTILAWRCGRALGMAFGAFALISWKAAVLDGSFEAAGASELHVGLPMVVPEHSRSPDVACYQRKCFLVWEDFRDRSVSEIFAASIPLNGRPLEGRKMVKANSLHDQAEPTISCGRRGCLVVWHEGDQLLATRLDLDGQSLDAQPLVISSGLAPPTPPDWFKESGNTTTGHSVTGDGDRFVVSWVASSQLYGCFIDWQNPRSCVQVNLDPRQNCKGLCVAHAPAIAFDGEAYVVVWFRYVWHQGHGKGKNWDELDGLWGVRVDGMSRHVGVPFSIRGGIALHSSSVTSDLFITKPALAVNRKRLLVVWKQTEDVSHGFRGAAEVHGAEVNAAGEVSSFAIMRAVSAATPRVLAHQDGFLVLAEQRDADGSSALRWARVDRSRKISAQFVVAPDVVPDQRPAMALLESDRLLVAFEGREGVGRVKARVVDLSIQVK